MGLWRKMTQTANQDHLVFGYSRSFREIIECFIPKNKTWHEDLVQKKMGKKIRWEDVFLRFFWGIAVMFQSWFGVFSKSWGCQRRRWPPAAGRWFSKWMGVACRLSPFTKMDGTACWGTGDSEGKRGAIVLLNCDTFFENSTKILENPRRSMTINEDPENSWIRYCKLWRSPQKKESMMRVWFTLVPVMSIFPLSMPLQVLLGHALQAWTGHADLLDGHGLEAHSGTPT